MEIWDEILAPLTSVGPGFHLDRELVQPEAVLLTNRGPMEGDPWGPSQP